MRQERKTRRTTGARGAAWRTVAVLLVVALSAAAPGRAVPAERVSLTLDQALALALEGNKELALARMREDGALARVGQARSGFLPQLTGSGSFTKLDRTPTMDTSGFGQMFSPLLVPFNYLVDHGYLDPSTLEGLTGGGTSQIVVGDDEIYSVGLTVRQPLFTGGAILGSYSAAKHGALAERWNRERTEDQVRYNVTEAYLNLVRAGAVLDVTENAVRQMRSHLSDVENLSAAGMILEKDAMAARVRMSEVELRENSAEHAIGLAMAALSFAMGIDVETEIEALDTLEGGEFPSRELGDWVGAAMTERPDLRAMTEGAEAAKKAVAVARSAYYPQLVFSGTYAWDRPNLQYEPEFYDHWSVTVAAQMNIFDWGRTRDLVKESRVGYLEVKKGVEMMSDAVRLEVRQAYLAHDEASRAVGIAKEGVSQAREAMRITRESFQNGMSTNSEVLDAESALTAAELGRINAVADLRLAEAKLELATGVDYK
jgi:outer membrane protein